MALEVQHCALYGLPWQYDTRLVSSFQMGAITWAVLGQFMRWHAAYNGLLVDWLPIEDCHLLWFVLILLYSVT